MNSFMPILTALGLSPEQADLYTSLVQNGPQTAIQLAKSTLVKRTYTYRITGQLMTLGLIRAEVKGKTTRYVAESPDKLLDIAQGLKFQAEQAAHSLENILPSLKSMFTATDVKPIITYFEGIEGVKKVYLDTIKEGQEILALLEPSKIEPDLERWLRDIYLPARIQSGVTAKVLVSSTEAAALYTAEDQEYLRETKLVPKEKFPLEHEVNIYGNKVALINNLAKDRLVGIIIDHPAIATTFRSWFTLTWENL